MVDVFISYSRDNKARVAKLADAVTRAGYVVWWDAELPPHRSYGDVITEKITSAKAAIVVWSHNSAQSEWVRAEADVARNQKKLIQTAIDDVMPPLPFNQIQFADLSDWNGEDDHSGWRKVKMSLTDLCGPRGAADGGAPAVVVAPVAPASQRSVAGSDSAPARPRTGLYVGMAGVALALAVVAWTQMDDDGSDVAMNAVVGSAADNVVADVKDDAGPGERFTLAAVINDSDGFSNIRERPTMKSAIVGKVLEGQKFLTYRQQGSWWRVRTADGTNGFMARRLIRVLDGPNPDPVPPPRVDSGLDASASDTADAESAMLAPDSATALAPSGFGVIIPGSSRMRLTAADVADLSAIEIRLARNEIFARKGMRFQDPRLAAHFAQFDWYRPLRDAVALNDVEKANVALLRAVEAQR